MTACLDVKIDEVKTLSWSFTIETRWDSGRKAHEMNRIDLPRIIYSDLDIRSEHSPAAKVGNALP